MGNFKPPFGTRLKLDHPLAQGLVGCWVMNERGGIKNYDLSLSGFPGTFVSTPQWVFGDVLLDGSSDYIDILDSVAGGHPYVDLDDNITLVFKINTTETGNAFGNAWHNLTAVIIELRQQMGSGGTIPFSIGLDDSVIHLSASSDSINEDDTVSGTINVSDGIDHWVIITINNNDWCIDVDNKLDNSGTFATATGTRNVGATICNFQLGVRSRDGGQKDDDFYAGSIGAFFLYKKTLTQSQKSAIFASPYAMFEDPYPIELFGHVAAVSADIIAQTINYNGLGRMDFQAGRV